MPSSGYLLGVGHSAQRMAARVATGKGEPVPGSVVRVWEETAPGAAPDLEWLLLSDQPLADFAQALACARQYASRWLIEDFHKALKNRIKVLGRGWGLKSCNCNPPPGSSRPWPC